VSAASDTLRSPHRADVQAGESNRTSPGSHVSGSLAAEPRSVWRGGSEAEAPSDLLPVRAHEWNRQEFAHQQILSLIQRVFFPGWPRPARQVVFSSVDDSTDAGATCARISLTMAKRLPGTVCVIEADPSSCSLERAMNASEVFELIPGSKVVRHGHRVQENLWWLRAAEFLQGRTGDLAWLRGRMSELRREFDYAVIHAPAAGACSETGLLGQIADGVILVLDERRTRRACAQEAKQVLQAANARLLGVVINDRQFPIPEIIYRKL
jgi:protein-tyrosine kinase